MVSLIPLFAVETLKLDIVNRLPGFKRRMQWFIDNRPDFREYVDMVETADGVRRLLSIVTREQMPHILRLMLDEGELLSPYGIRALSQVHRQHPYMVSCNGLDYQVCYEPAKSSPGLFGGNSNWRGPVWFPVNYLIIESLQKFYYFFGDDLKVECPTGSGHVMSLWNVGSELYRRLTRIFQRGARR